MAPGRSYLICSVPRSGGGLLAGLLRSTGVAGRPEEYFWRDDQAVWRQRWSLEAADDFVARTLEEGSTANGVFGARVMWGYVDDVVAMLGSTKPHPTRTRHDVLQAALPELRYVHLVRRDAIAQAVSWAKAIQTGEWFAGDRRRTRAAPVYDERLLEGLISEIADGERGWDGFFGEAGAEPLRVTFEDLVREPEAVTRSVLRFLQLPVEVPIKTLTTPQADITNAEWTARHHADHRKAKR